MASAAVPFRLPFLFLLLTIPSCDAEEDRMHATQTVMLQVGFRDFAEPSMSRFEQLVGETNEDIAAKLNKFIREHASVHRVVPCSGLSIQEVTALKSVLVPDREECVLEGFGVDDGRRLALPTNAADFQHEMMPAQQEVLRNALCAETLKFWAHHLPASAKTASANVTLPSMPVYDQPLWHGTGSLVNRTYGCIQGHQMPNMDKVTPWAGWPSWPLRGHFKSKGHGPFPFWHFGAPASGIGRNAMMLNLSVATPYLYNPGNDLEVWYDMANKITKFYHARCDLILADLPGHDGVPCVHLMTGGLGSGKWWIYSVNTTTKKSDGKFCCDDSFGSKAPLGTLNAKFMDGMYYYGEVNFTGDYFTGKAHRYQSKVLAPPSPELDVWYETDLKGRPLRFGEVGSSDAEHAPYQEGGYLTSENLPLLYTDYDRVSWEFGTESIADLETDVPEACLQDYIPDCKVPAESISDEEVARTGYLGKEHRPTCAVNLIETFWDSFGDSVPTYDICDVTTGVLVHQINGTMNHVRPQLACHDYIVVEPLVSTQQNTLTNCQLGSLCDICSSVTEEMVLARASATSGDCLVSGKQCEVRIATASATTK